ncbi:hypothetical protein [Methylocystis sp.]|uniref:hypothetical protein n=1 Tax=Methylocystis sp. TaxID=1911079 RepID=UPI0026009D55|nr:hypothetical protein [Methylocystis sp.]
MALAETQALLARLFTEEELRREYFEAPLAVATRFGLSVYDTQRLAALDRCETEAFARSLIGKRTLYARKALPLTARALGDRFDALLWEAIRGRASDGKLRADAAALVALLERRIAQRDLAPVWIVDLARFELAFVEAGRSGPALFFRRFEFDIASIANSLAKDEDVSAIRRGAVGVWARLPRGRLRWRLFPRQIAPP